MSTLGVRSDRTPAPHNWHTENCIICAYLPLCFGGCRYMTLLRTGSTAGIDCRKPYFDIVLERLVLQDIRYQVGIEARACSATVRQKREPTGP